MTRHAILRARRTLVAVGALLLAGACTDPATPPGEGVHAPVTITATLTPAQQALVAGMSVEVTGLGITTPIVVTLAVAGATVNGIVQVPVGSVRTFTVRAFDAQGRESYNGSATADVVAGTNPPLTVRMAAVEGNVPIDVTIGTYGVTLTPSSASVAVNAQVTLTANVTTNGTAVSGPLTWGVVNPALVTLTVAADGRSAVVRGKIAGSTRVVASYAGVAAASTITVTSGSGGTNQLPVVGSISHPANIYVGVPVTFTATASDPDGSVVEYRWVFSNLVTQYTTTTGSLTVTFSTAGSAGVAVGVVDNQGGLSASPARTSTFTVQAAPPPTGLAAASVYAGGSHSCALTSDGRAYCWGYNDFGQLGNGARGISSRPVAVVMPAGVAFTSMHLGNEHTCGQTSSGDVWCWGANGLGQFGDGTTAEMVFAPKFVGNWAQYSVGEHHGCGTQAGVYKCWGYNIDRRVRNTSDQFLAQPVEVLPPSGYSYVEIDAGISHTCAIMQATSAQTTPQRAVQCWGAEPGSFGGGFAFGSGTSVPTLSGLVAAYGWTCAREVPTGSLWCWGRNESGQQATGTSSTLTGPQRATGAPTTALTAGSNHMCAASMCWGSNQSGQLGNGSTAGFSYTPVAISGGSYFGVATGQDHGCGIKDGKVYCWGYNLWGQLGDGTTTTRRSPVEVLSPAP